MEYELINTVVISIVLAFICGFTAKKLKFPPLLGYLVAGILIGPFTPGFVADTSIAKQLSELGIILLMFGVGLHFSFPDLLKVKRIAVPGAVFQMLVSTLAGFGVAFVIGKGIGESLLYGLCLSVASTVVLLRTLEQRSDLHSATGKISVGWLIVQDIAMILALVLLPVIAELQTSGQEMTAGFLFYEVIEVTLKITGFILIMVVFGRKLLPWLLVSIAKTRSSELSTLGTLAIALGFAYVAYTAFDASFALGAFLAGLVLSESEIGHKAAEKSMPMRNAFAVLFFVTVGMLFDPMTIVEEPLMVTVTMLVIIISNGGAALAISYFFRQPRKTAFTIAISLAQIGEFSFIMAGLALGKGMIGQDIYNLILASALLSIAINPLLFKLMDRLI